LSWPNIKNDRGYDFANRYPPVAIPTLIDAPEILTSKNRAGQPFSIQSTQHLSRLILNKTVDMKPYGADRNGRTLAEVFLLNGRNVNIEMLQAGFAEVYRGNLLPVWKWNRTGRQKKKPGTPAGVCARWGISMSEGMEEDV
jgi:endonuclease YncB( thermonuclease family)